MSIHRSLVVSNTQPFNIRKVQLRVIDFLDGRPSTLRLIVYMNDGSRAYMDASQFHFEDDIVTVDEARKYATGANWEVA
jgi:hypothetical protein